MWFSVDLTYHAGYTTDIELPIQSWKDVKDWYVKWNTFYYTIDGENWKECELPDVCDELVDYKRPDLVIIKDQNAENELEQKEF